MLRPGARTDTDSTDRTQYGLGVRYQQAFGNRFVGRFDAFVADQENFDTGWGSRVELQVKF